MLAGFKKFLMRGNVVDLAVAVVIGAAFTAVVTSIVGNLVMPLVTAIFGKQDFSDLTFTINGSEFGYGAVLNAVVAFLTVATVVYFLVVVPLNRLSALRKTGAVPEAEAAPTQQELLTQIRDLLKENVSR